MEEASVLLNEAQVEDLEELYDIELESFSVPWSRESIAKAVEDASQLVLAARNGGRTVGYGIMHLLPPEAELYSLAVRNDSRCSGIGRRLLSELLSRAGSDGVTDIFLEVRESNMAARRLYRSSGFFEIGVRKKYYETPIEDAIIMKLVIG